MPLLDRLSPEAQAIGAVNTIVRTKGAGLLGENTDWLGIARPLAAALGGGIEVGMAAAHSPHTVSGAALVLGAGGTARAAIYAARRLGLSPVMIWNR